MVTGVQSDVLRAQVDERLDQLLSEKEAQISAPQEAMRYMALAPGKRLRPLLTLAATQQFCGEPSAALNAACATEMVHAASLILDDLPCMDDAKMRRNQPTVHRHFGESIAILAAISLLARAFECIAQDDDLSDATRNQLNACLSGAVGTAGLALGQAEDLFAGDTAAQSYVETMYHRKTAVLFIASAEMGAIIAGADGTERRRVQNFARHVGLAYQIIDDLADGVPAHALDKDTGQDIGKPTLVALMGPDAARVKVKQHLDHAMELAAQTGRGTTLQDFVHQHFISTF